MSIYYKQMLHVIERKREKGKMKRREEKKNVSFYSISYINLLSTLMTVLKTKFLETRLLINKYS